MSNCRIESSRLIYNTVSKVSQDSFRYLIKLQNPRVVFLHLGETCEFLIKPKVAKSMKIELCANSCLKAYIHND